MSDLPNGWRKALIEELLEDLDVGKRLHQGWSPRCHKEPSEDHDVWGVLKTTAIQKGEFQPEHNKRLPDTLEPRPNIEVKAGDLLLTCAGPRVRCGIPCMIRTTRPKLMMSGKMYRFRADRSQIEPEYLEAFLLSNDAQDAINRMKTGISESGLNLTHGRFKTLEVPVAPLPEQRRIVARIEELFSRINAGVAALRHAKAQLQRYRQSVLAAAVTGQLTGGETTSWSNETVADACETVTDGDHQAPPKVPAGIPFLTIGNISSGRLDFSKTRFVPQDYFDQIKIHRIPTPNDVLYSVVGATIGIPVLVNTDRSFCFQRHIALLRPSSRVLPQYLHLFMASPQTFHRAWAGTTGSAQPTLPLKALRALPISLPPLAEQHRIVAEVESRTTAIDHLEAELDRQITRSNGLRQSTLAAAFSGQISTQS